MLFSSSGCCVRREQIGHTCLHTACKNGHVDVAKYLCERGGERLLMLTMNVSHCLLACTCFFEAYVCQVCNHACMHKSEAGLDGHAFSHTRAPAQCHALWCACLHLKGFINDGSLLCGMGASNHRSQNVVHAVLKQWMLRAS